MSVRLEACVNAAPVKVHTGFVNCLVINTRGKKKKGKGKGEEGARGTDRHLDRCVREKK